MRSIRRNKFYHHYRPSVRAVLTYSLVMLVGLILWSGRYLSSDHHLASRRIFVPSNLLSSNDFTAGSSQSCSSAFLSEVPTEDIEVIDESGSHDDAPDMELSKVSHEPFSFIRFSISPERATFAQLAQSVQSRTRDHLFVLHRTFLI